MTKKPKVPAPTAPPPDLPYIAEGLRPLAVPCDTLTLDPANVRDHGRDNLDALRGSLKAFGQVKTIVVNRDTSQVLAGNATLTVARELGWTHIAVVFVQLDPANAKTYAIADNRISDLSSFDEEALAAILPELDRQCAELAKMIADMEAEASSDAKDHAAELIEHAIIIKCQGEADQRQLLEELARHNLDLRALVVDFPKREAKPAKPGPELQAGEIVITRSSEIERTPRVMQLEGLFDIPPTKRPAESWRLKVALDRPWNIGLIVGPSGSGKTTVARELFGQNIVAAWPWSSRAIIDDFPESMTVTDITAILSSVGFSSPPSWLKPFAALSNGEQFRVTLARTLAEQQDLAVMDEFTSVVDRTVAQIGSAALAKSVRGTGRKFIAVACHYDVEDWLQPDWIINMPSGRLTWRLLRRRPEIQLHIRRTQTTAWENFRRHHYLDHELNRSAMCFLAEVAGRPAAFTAVLHYPNAQGGFWREHRTVCLPDFQGVGIGNTMSEYIASMVRCKGKPYRSVTTHPAMILHRLRSPLWRCHRAPSLQSASAGTYRINASRSAYRMTASFEYVGPRRETEARELGVLKPQQAPG